MSRSTSRGSSPRPTPNSTAPTSSPTRSTRSRPRDRSDHDSRPARAAPDHDDAQGAGRARQARARRPGVDAADLPEPGEDALLEPGLRKSVTLLREFAATPEQIRADKAIDDRIRLLRHAQRADRATDQVTEIDVERTAVEAAASRDRRDLLLSRRSGGELHRLPEPRSKACRSRSARAASPTKRDASCPGCTASAGRAAGLREPSAPTGPTASA